MSRLTRTQNRELSFRCITYNMHRLTNLVILMMFSTKPLLPLYIKDSNPISKISLSSVHSNELGLISQYEGVLSTVILTDEVRRMY